MPAQIPEPDDISIKVADAIDDFGGETGTCDDNKDLAAATLYSAGRQKHYRMPQMSE